MGSFFEVSTGDLHSLAAQLSALVQELGQASDIRPDLGASGHPGVDASLESFFGSWHDGMQHVEANLADFGKRLAGAGAQYEGAETSVTHSFGRG